MSFDKFEEEIMRKFRKIIVNFLYDDEVYSFRKMAREQVKEDIIKDLKELCNERNRSWTENNIFRVREENLKKIIKKWREW